jgi:uncharacterized protein YecT (DUF1311 family)
MIRSVVVVLVTSIAILCGQHGAGAQARCPLSTMDACDRWHLEQIDQQLAQVVAEAVEKIERFAHPDVRQEAKEALAESQRAFMASREADCRAEAAFMYLRTAKTRESFTISCMYALTELRIARLKQRYLL